MFEQSIPQDILQARDNAPQQPMPKETVQAGNRMMIEKILRMPVQPYQDGLGVFRVVETVGRKTRQIRRVPLAVFQYEGHRYLIAPSRERDWVHNLISSDVCTLVTNESHETVHIALTLDDAAIKAVRAYMAPLPGWALRQFPFSVAASDQEIRAKREAFAVFRLV